MDISARLPWKTGVALAIVAYLILHYFATRASMTTNPVELSALGKTVGDSVVHGVWRMMASVLQYIVPLALFMGAFVSFLRRRRQSELHDRVASDSSADALDKISWREFEGLTAESFRRQGYRVVERGAMDLMAAWTFVKQSEQAARLPPRYVTCHLSIVNRVVTRSRARCKIF